MLSVKHYPKDYVDSCRARLRSQLVAYDDAAVSEAFRTEFLNNLILVLEQSFVHRMRGNEGKDGNPLNEVRMLAASILTNGAVLTGEPSIKYDAERSVLGLAVGETITIDLDQFRQLADRYFDTIEERFPE